MSNAIQTLPATTAKLFSDRDPVQFVQFVTDCQFPGLGNDATVKPGMIRMSHKAASTAMGGKVSAHAFVEGLMWHVCKFAYGDNMGMLQKGLPKVAQFALVAACNGVKQGAGIDLHTLRATVTIALAKTLALPAPAPKERDGIADTGAVPKVDNVAASVKDTGPSLSDLIRIAADAPIDTRKAIPNRLASNEQDEIGAALTNAAAAKEHADAAAAAAKADAAEKAFAALVEREARLTEARTVAFCRLADELGVKLTKAQLAMLTKLEQAA